MFPKINIITVVYNSVTTLEKTIQSIITQTYNNIEYIVIDGGSTDGTINIIERYRSHIEYFVSQPDKGLYDAMNKGLEAATGDYIWFINAGDEIFESETVKQIFESKPAADIYYGETIVTDLQGNNLGKRRLKAPKKLTWKSFKMGMLVSHQAIIVKRLLAPKYDLKYKYSADFEWVLVILTKAQHICNTNLILCRFLDGGRTKQTIIPGLKERYRIMCQYYGCITTFFRHIIIGVKFMIFVILHRRF